MENWKRKMRRGIIFDMCLVAVYAAAMGFMIVQYAAADSTNLACVDVASNPTQGEVAVNAINDCLDEAMNDTVTLTITGNTTVSATEFNRNFELKLGGTPGSAFNLTVPTNKRHFRVRNGTGKTATVKYSSGATVTVLDGESRLLYGDGTDILLAEVPAASPYDVGISRTTGTPSASAVLIDFVFTRSVIFPAGLTNSQGTAGTAATAQTDFDIQKNGSSVGTMRFAASGTTATFIMSVATTYAAGDKLKVIAPASPDATLASVNFTLAGTR